ncbi:MAG: nicotinate phosphoribosyltransferase [Defluviitaleaceae bacterium]|nr:nicotinate phosphoribosyltransferase [Defluviitaleaceae bacterium]
MDKRSLLTDFYQLTMMQARFRAGDTCQNAIFDMFIRENPGGNGFSVFAGLAQFVEYIDNLGFDGEDVGYLQGLGIFDDDFLEYLREFRFTGDISAMAEGSVFFPTEPVVIVKAPLIQANFIETAMLNILNHQSLIATKAARVCHAAGDDDVLEFGLRRAQGADAGVLGARAAIIGGCAATSNVLAGKKFGLPLRGTHSHSWVMSFDCELKAFRQYANAFPDKCILLVDTFDTINSGVPNAIKVFGEMRAKGVKLQNYGIRLDSGDLAYLSKIARQMLDDAGYKDARISASSDLDEDLIQSLKLQGAKIDVWGVGTRLITSMQAPAMGGVYKLVAAEEDGRMMPKIKLSENPAKVTIPGKKKVWRIYDANHNKIKADLIMLVEETLNTGKNLTLFDPKDPWKKMHLTAGEYYAKELLQPIFEAGKQVYQSPSTLEIRDFCRNEQQSLWDEHRRLVNPHVMPVDLSQKLYDLKQKMLHESRKDMGETPSSWL